MTTAAGAWTVRLRPDRSGVFIEGGREPPAVAEDATHTLVFDGVLFNRRELAESAAGNDTQLLLEKFADRGPALLNDLRGAFALIVWNRRTRSLVATRDPLGMHPLFYAKTGGELVLSWSIDGLLGAGASREVNRIFVAEHLLRRWRSIDETYFSAIRRIPAGHLLRVAGDVRLERYLEPPERRPSDDWMDEFEHALDQAVDRCLELGRAGIYLSGGVDSTSVALAATRRSRLRRLPPPVALSITFPERTADETAQQEVVTAALGLPRRTSSANGDESGHSALIEKSLAAIARRGAPLGAPWDLAYETLARDARAEGCAIVLTGEGGDEWLTVPHLHAADLLQHLEFRKLGAFLNANVAADFWGSALRPLVHRAVTQRLAHVAPSVHARYRRTRHAVPSWLARDEQLRTALAERLDLPPLEPNGYAEAARRSALWHPLASMHLEDSYTTGRLLGTPVLHPLWDVDLVRLVYTTPPEVLEPGGRRKGLAVAVVRKSLPNLGQAWPGRARADVFLDGILQDGLVGAWRGIGGPKALSHFGIVDPAKTGMIEPGSGGETLPLRDLWAIVKAEVWLRPRIEG